MSWEPSLSFEERLKAALTPPRLYIRYKARKELKHGEKELALLPFLVAKDRVSLDVGANKGVYTWFLARLSRHVHAFEPNPKLFRILKAGAAANVTAHALALSNVSGSAELRIPRGNRGYSNQGGTLIELQRDHAVVSVPTRRLDDLDIADIGFIKIDVEGFELKVLEGARQTLQRDRPRLLVELEERHTGMPIAGMIAQIEGYGYRCLALRRGVLVSADRLDPAVDHRGPGTPGYVFNFIFLPL
jgi:FkbM family methyltransferase